MGSELRFRLRKRYSIPSTTRRHFDAGGGLPGNQYTLVGRLDYNLTDKTQMFFRVGRENIVFVPV